MNERKSVLFVEPDQEFRKATAKILEQAGYRVVTAQDGLDALGILKDYGTDLIISALRMPRIDGVEFMQEIKRTKIAAPVVFLTAFGDVESYMDLMNMGAFEYINKPIKEKDLLHVASKAIERQGVCA